MEQFEQLLTCAICLDRYRNPKLLPCQHSFCMEPCLEGLVDYVRRQVKCPECRAEHRVPYQGVQGFPTNVTLQRFLELHIEITGELPDPTSGQVMERCNVCSEKAYCSFCYHCEKKICEECKGAHMEILRREIARINNQIRRGIHRLQDSLNLVEKNTQNIQTNCLSVSEEIEEIYRRLNKALKDRTEYLRGEIDRYLTNEMRTLTSLKQNLEQEISNIVSNCDLADKHMNENVDIWDDCELMDAKEIFLKTVEFLRNFEYENTDYTRKIRLVLAHDPNQLVLHVAGFGDLNIANSNNPFSQGTSTGLLQPPGPGLMRSKSDHRLAFRNQDQGYERGYGDQESESGLRGRKFGDRQQKTGHEKYGSSYGRSGDDYGDDYDHEGGRSARGKYSSRFRRRNTVADDDSDNESRVRFQEQQKGNERERPLDTEDVTRGPLSGITRLADSPRVMKKLQENPTGKKEKKETPAQPQAPKQPAQVVPKRAAPPTTRQTSEDDEISRIKKQNKGATTSTESPTETRPAERPTVEERHPAVQRKTTAAEAPSSAEDSEESISALQPQRKAAAQSKASQPQGTRRPSDAGHKKTVRSASSDSSSSAESSSSAVRNTGAPFTTEEVKQKYLARSEVPARPAGTKESQTKQYPSRYANSKSTTPVKKDEDESETSSEEETESEEESDEPSSIAAAAVGTSPRSQYLQKCQQLFQIGSRGSEAGCFTWPRGVAVGPDNSIVVADSSNHRVQVFDSRGRFLKEFGQYGSGEGEFDCLAGVAVNRIGQYIIADRYNHRIQVFDPSGRFLRAFGSQGTSDGRFNYPWGIATDALGFIYVCDKENHRIQVFQSDGTFVGKFGTMGNKEGQLEHPHYIAVSNTNRVIVSDSNNHRIQVFDVNGKVLSSFGREGSEEGEFKFPRGVAVDDQGYICVADSGNNRIQIFHPDGTFLRALGCWGSQKGEFKGLEGVAMTPDGHILVCDRENHRIQVF
ncbi:RING finger protein nhl-1 isoform X2 [Euwallacea fornicatus]|uniref:RING finger protein nhl-1 isoform X2 n=1 Tax=Euwallacea fornicatus TaxID=995702 RepID=UPI00338E3D11